MVAGECDSDKKCESSEFKKRNLFWQFLAVLPVKKTNKKVITQFSFFRNLLSLTLMLFTFYISEG